MTSTSNPLWGYIKTLLYATPVDNEEAPHRRLVGSRHLSTVATVHDETCRGEHFEHFNVFSEL
jgi:hypothetical protein